jgi:hypothetical protein
VVGDEGLAVLQLRDGDAHECPRNWDYGGSACQLLVSGVVPVLTFGTCDGGFQYFVEKVLGLPFLCLGLGLAAAGTLLTRLAEFVAGAPYVE